MVRHCFSPQWAAVAYCLVTNCGAIYAAPPTSAPACFAVTSINTHKIYVENFWGQKTTPAAELFKASYVSDLVTATYSIARTSYFGLQTYAGVHIDASSYGYLYGIIANIGPKLQQAPWISFIIGGMLIRGILRPTAQTYFNIYQNDSLSVKIGFMFIKGNPLNPLVLKDNNFFSAMKWYNANIKIKSERDRMIIGRMWALLAGNNLLEQDQVGFSVKLEFFCS